MLQMSSRDFLVYCVQMHTIWYHKRIVIDKMITRQVQLSDVSTRFFAVLVVKLKIKNDSAQQNISN